MKRYIREIFIPEYAKNFNKGLSAEDIKLYGKIHFSRDRSENKLNMHSHLIISRKDQSSKVKISPLTNHRNTKKGVIKGGFDRTALFENVEKGFDKLFGYNRQLSETFEYCNTKIPTLPIWDYPLYFPFFHPLQTFRRAMNRNPGP